MHIVLEGGALLVIGAALTALVFARSGDGWRSAGIGFFYAAAAVISFRVISHLLSGKLDVFPTIQQWILKAGLYTLGLSVAYLLGIVFHTLLLIPREALWTMLIDQFWNGFIYLISLPFSRNDPGRWLDWRMRSVVITFFTVLFLIGVVSLVFSLVEMRWRAARQKRAVQQAELAALRAQMEPHFLFNSLHTIAALIKSDPERAETLLIQLSRMLRYVFQHSGAATVRLGDEFNFTRQFVTLLQARYGESLQVQWRIEPGREDDSVPNLLIQPLIENAVRHGRTVSDQPLTVGIKLTHTGQALVLTVTDNGMGMGPEKLKTLPLAGHALANIAERLHLQYGSEGLMTIASLPGKGTTVTIRLPV